MIVNPILSQKSGGFIYAIGVRGMPYVKIGSARFSVLRRLRLLQTGHPFQLEILAALPVEDDRLKIEHQIHRFLANEHIKGEWFEVVIDESRLADLIVRAAKALIEPPAGVAAPMPTVSKRPHSAGTDGKTLGERIRFLRERQDLSQRDLCAKTGIRQALISELETGRKGDTRGASLLALASVFGITVDALLEGVDLGEDPQAIAMSIDTEEKEC